MEFRALGPLEVLDGKRTLPLGGFRQRLVLGVLLLHGNRVVSTDRLIDAVWGEDPPRTARKTLQVYIARLRRLLGEGIIEASGNGYSLRVDPERFDVARFEAAVETGRQLLAADPTDAGRVLRGGLALWRGRPWGDLGDEHEILPEMQRLRELRLAAIEERVTADLACGRAGSTVAELENLVDEHPLRERLRGQLMLALYRTGRQADALRVFQEARRILGEELGIDPSPDLRELEERILLHDPELAGTETAAAEVDWRVARNPYKGLRAFEERDAPDFFGRADLVEDLEARVRRDRFVAVVGASGSGKSSAVLAGLLPRLRTSEDGLRWTVATMTPGEAPLERLGATLRAVVPAADQVMWGRGDDLDLVRAAGRICPDDDTRLLLVVDQFEELLHQVTEEVERRRFVRMLVEGVEDPACRLTVLIALRADFFDRLLQTAGMGDLARESLVGVVPLGASEIEAAATRPARSVGIGFEPELVAEITARMADRPGALPLFQYVLTELFEQRTGDTLTRTVYRQLGGLHGALGRRAEETYLSLDHQTRSTARQVFLRLVNVGEDPESTRRRVEIPELEGLGFEGASLKTALDAFDHARLLTFDRNPATGESTVEVAHEALFRAWPRLARWTDEAREDIHLHHTLLTEVAEWEDSGRDPDYLLTGSRLATYQAWRDTGMIQLTDAERAFLDAGADRRMDELRSERARHAGELNLQRRSMRLLRVLVVVVSLAALVAAGLSVLAVRRSSQAAASERESRARELANASVLQLDQDPDLALLLALEAIDVTRSVDGSVLRETEEALHQAVNADRILMTASGAYDVAFLPDGRLVAGGSVTRVLDLSGEGVATTSFGIGEILAVAATPDGTLIATGQGNGTLTVWETATGQPVQTFTRAGLPAHGRAIRDVVFSPDGALLASAPAGPYGDQGVRVWDVATGEQVATIDSPDGAVWNILGETPQLAFHPDGIHLAATGFSDEVARVFNVAAGEWDFFLPGLDAPARGVVYFDGGDRIATTSVGGTIDILDGAGRLLYTLAPPSDQQVSFYFVAVSPDGSKLAAAADDGIIRVWNLLPAGGQPAMTLPGGDMALGLSFSPDGTTLAAADGQRVRLWDVSPAGQGEVATFEGGGFALGFGPDGDRLAMRVGGDVSVVDTRTWATLAVLDHPSAPDDESGPLGLAWSPDGSRIATGAAFGDVFIGPGLVQIWDAATGAALTTLGKSQPRLDVAFDDEKVAAAVCERPSPDATTWESPARVWDAATGEVLFVVPASDCGHAVDLHGSLLAVQSERTEKVQLWDLATGRLLGAVDHNPGPAGAARFSPDGTLLLTAGWDGTARVWDVATLSPVVTFEGHAGPVTRAVWSSDGETIFTGGSDGTVRMWNARTGEMQLVLAGHHGLVAGLSITPDGSRVASSDTEGISRIWTLDLDELVGIARDRVSRSLTAAECVTYHFAGCPS